MRLKYSVSNWIFGEEELESICVKLQRFGYDGIELMGEPERYSAQEVRKLCADHGLEVLSIAGIYPWPTGERDLSNPDPGVRRRAVDYLRRCCDLAAELGAPLVIVVPSAVGKTVPVGNPQDEKAWEEAVKREWDNAVESLRDAARHAEATGVMLAVEPINRYETFLINTAAQGLQLISEIGSKMVKLHLDSFHMNIEESDPAGAIRQAKDLLVNFHVADSNRQAVGRGHLDFKGIIAALYEIDYHGALALEPLPPVPDPYMAVRFRRYRDLLDTYLEESIAQLKRYEAEVSEVTGGKQ
ncbi:TPA: sugar phosphate isomerase/epimerase [Candidatus Bipolaricaulota bacterium]|nr:sugar phosphate isomerase/epimerase [Candidatus Bipolaricaulota bacterium]